MMRTNFLMHGLGMMHNSMLTMEVRWKLLNEQIQGGGIPLYHVQAACLRREELEIIKHGARVSL